MKKAEVTVFLSLIFILLVTFAGSVLESASIQVAKNYRRADMNRAVECLFAEYQKELLEEYDLFAFDASYQKGDYSENLLSERLEFYEIANTEQSIERIKFLSDEGAFGEQVNAYMEHKYGLDFLKDKLGVTAIWNQQNEDAADLVREDQTNQSYLNQLLKENEGELPTEDNPISHVDQLKKSPILELVMPKGKYVSEKSISLAETLSHREKNEGYGDFSDVAQNTGTLNALLLGEYLLEHFSAATDGEGNVLDYEMEYLIAGESTDRENLETVVNKLMLIRFVPNFMFLQSSPGKKAEAEALAVTLCSLLAVPAITTAAAQGILLAWAYGESLVDIRALLKGSKVPLIKNADSWQLSLAGLLKLGEEGDLNDGADSGNGMDYREYLRILLFLANQDTLEIRALDLIEQNLRKIHGISNFHADFCVTKIEFQSKCSLRRGITYQFPTYFGYQ